MAWWDEATSTVRDLAERIGPAVVGVGHRWAVGSGVVVAPDRILTNAHNLRGDEVRITFHDGRTETGRAQGVDVDGDVAVVSVDTKGAAAIDWAETTVDIGTPVFALSNPGGRGLRVTFGFVSGTARSFRGPRGRRITGSLEHTSPLLPGSSGGPIVDTAGRILGLNTNRLGEGFYLAIPADADLRRKVDELSEGRSPSRRRLGIGVAPAEVARRMRRAVGLPEVEGLLVRQVEEDGPAAAAGLAEGDLIVEANGREVATADDLYDSIDGAGSNAIDLKVVRGAEEKMVSVPSSASAA